MIEMKKILKTYVRYVFDAVLGLVLGTLLAIVLFMSYAGIHYVLDNWND